jgi:hypothetical protein
MAKSLDKVLQSDGTYKWELVEPDLSQRMGNGTACPAPTTQSKTESKKKTPKKKTTNTLFD